MRKTDFFFFLRPSIRTKNAKSTQAAACRTMLAGHTFSNSPLATDPGRLAVFYHRSTNRPTPLRLRFSSSSSLWLRLSVVDWLFGYPIILSPGVPGVRFGGKLTARWCPQFCSTRCGWAPLGWPTEAVLLPLCACLRTHHRVFRCKWRSSAGGSAPRSLAWTWCVSRWGCWVTLTARPSAPRRPSIVGTSRVLHCPHHWTPCIDVSAAA
jgi:hypothetical protein